MRLHSPLSALVFVTGLFGITGCASEPETDARKAGSEASIEERQRIVQFWELHRKATRLRLDARSDEAIAAYEDALRLNDSHEDALYYLANLYLNAGRFSEADRTLTRLTSAHPESARGFLRRGELHLCFADPAPLDPKAAAASFQRALALNSEETGPMLRLAQAALLQGRLDTTQSWLEAIVGTHPSSIEANFLMGFLDWMEGDTSSARLRYRNTLDLIEAHPNDPVVGEGDRKTGGAIKPGEQPTCPLMLSLLDVPLSDEDGSQAAAAFEHADAVLRALSAAAVDT